MQTEKRFAAIVLGASNSGKSHTWQNLFGHKVYSNPVSPLELDLGDGEVVDVVLRNSSCEESDERIEDRLPEDDEGNVLWPSILLLAVQYPRRERAVDRIKPTETLKTLLDNGYELYVQWLNPGYDQQRYTDDKEIVAWLRQREVTVDDLDSGMVRERTDKMRDIIRDWAKANGLA